MYISSTSHKKTCVCDVTFRVYDTGSARGPAPDAEARGGRPVVRGRSSSSGSSRRALTRDRSQRTELGASAGGRSSRIGDRVRDESRDETRRDREPAPRGARRPGMKSAPRRSTESAWIKSAFKNASVFAIGSSIEALAEGERIHFHATNHGHKRSQF